MRSNVTRGGGVAILVEIDKATELALYDALPKRWRRLVDGLPVLQRVATIEEYRARLGDELGYARVVEVFSRKFPGWRPPEPDRTDAPSRAERPLSRRRARGSIVVPSSEGGRDR